MEENTQHDTVVEQKQEEAKTMPPAQESSASSGSEQKEESKKSNNRLVSALAYLGILVVVPVLLMKDDAFTKFHVKQGLVLIVTGIIISICSWVPIVGWIASTFGGLAVLIWVIIGIVNALNGKTKELPFIGQFAKEFDF